MVTMAQRLEALRMERGLSRPALSAALGFPKTAMEKFETGRQTPTQDQQRKLADYFGVTLPYLRGESDDPAEGDSWLSGSVPAEEPAFPPAPAASSVQKKPRPAAVQEDGAVFGALLKSPSFQAMMRAAALEALRSPEGQELLAKAVRRELGRR
ncbi:helix-turn-helix domain-containing protein [Oscillibacter sp.]|uniref:helix-turn-helix domain-containing protein n=1 Tax=Oscillibacter sp. TaxID=1945593 RepID=UPI002D80C9AF|nr:helix-turn-helix transcriptional regulator [Oscillibacter sp.]